MFILSKKFNWVPFLPYICLVALIGLSFVSEPSIYVSAITFAFLTVAVLSSVYHAEDIAHSIGEGLGALVLALSVTVIEAGLIISLMSSGGDGASSIARDTIFAAVMIICNGMVGICLLLGGLKYKEVGFQFRGANSLLLVIVALAVICFILPNYTTSIIGPYYNAGQLIFVSTMAILLYIALIITQTRTHRYYFEYVTEMSKEVEPPPKTETNKIELIKSFVALFIGLATVIGLAKLISPAIESSLALIGAPKAVVGLFIALIVLLPEAITAVLAAKENRLQTSLNLALGSGAASIALTIPVVSAFSIIKNQPLMLGLDAKSMVFLFLTIVTCILTLGNGRATALHGVVHLIIMLAYFAVTLIP